MKSLEVWRSGYKADFSPWRWRSKCKVSPLPCLPWDSVGGVGQGQFCILHKSGIDSPPSGALLGCPLALYAGTAGGTGAAPGRWFRRGFRLGGALLLSFSRRSSLTSLLSRFSALFLASPGRLWLWCLTGWRISSAGAGLSSVLLLAVVVDLAMGVGAGLWASPALRPLPLLGAVSGLWCCCLPLPSLLGAGVPLLSSGAGLLCAGAGCWPWVG